MEFTWRLDEEESSPVFFLFKDSPSLGTENLIFIISRKKIKKNYHQINYVCKQVKSNDLQELGNSYQIAAHSESMKLQQLNEHASIDLETDQ